MCYPMIALAVGGVMSAVGAYQGGRAEEAFAESKADQLRMQGKDAQERADIQANMIRRKGSAMRDKQMAQMVANGVVIDADGTTGELLADTAMITELDALTALNNGEREAYYAEYSARSELARGKNKKRAGTIQAVGTLLGTAGSIGSSFISSNADLASQGLAEQSFGDFFTQSV